MIKARASGSKVCLYFMKKGRQARHRIPRNSCFPFFLDGDVPRSTSYGVYVSQLIRFARVSSHVTNFNARNKILTGKLLQQSYRYHKLRKAFSKFYRRHYEFVSKFKIGLKSLFQQGLSEPEFYGDLVNKLRKNC